MSLLENVRTRLTLAGVVNTNAPCYIGYMPDQPDACISLHWSGGYAQDTHGGENLRETFQVKVRAGHLGHLACETRWRQVFDALHDQETLLGVSLIQAMATGPLAWNDEKNRVCMSVNFNVERARP